MVRGEIWACLARLKREGQAILVVDKHVDRLLALADRHVVIEKGRRVWQGTSAEFLAAPGSRSGTLASELSRSMATVGVIGAGAWGTALAVVAARAGTEVRLWGRDRAQIACLAARRRTRATFPVSPSPRPCGRPPSPRPARGRHAAAGGPRPAGAGGLPRAAGQRRPLVVCAKGLERATGCG